jgi:hypothetical protein
VRLLREMNKEFSPSKAGGTWMWKPVTARSKFIGKSWATSCFEVTLEVDFGKADFAHLTITIEFWMS